jgi:hypothetical protein
MTYNEAAELFKRARDKDRGYRLPGRQGSTRLIKTDRGYAIRLHRTNVVTITPKNTYIRIGTYSPVQLCQSEGYQYGMTSYSERCEGGEHHEFDFYEGIEVTKTGQPVKRKDRVSTWETKARDERNARNRDKAAQKRREQHKDTGLGRLVFHKIPKQLNEARGVD